MFWEIAPVHLKDLTKGARNSIGVWWLVASLRWEVLGCIPLPHRPEKSSDLEGEEPLSQAVQT